MLPLPRLPSIVCFLVSYLSFSLSYLFFRCSLHLIAIRISSYIQRYLQHLDILSRCALMGHHSYLPASPFLSRASFAVTWIPIPSPGRLFLSPQGSGPAKKRLNWAIIVLDWMNGHLVSVGILGSSSGPFDDLRPLEGLPASLLLSLKIHSSFL